MKTISKYASCLSAAAFGLFLLSSCDDSKNYYDYTAYEGASAEYYFKIQNTQQFDLGDDDEGFAFTIYRMNDEAAASTQLQWSGDTDVFPNLPTAAAFAAGQSSLTLNVPVDLEKLTPLEFYNLEVAVPDTEDTPFSQSSIDFTIRYLSWAPLGNCQYTDYMICTLWGAPEPTYDVPIAEHPSIKGLYRLTNPYGEYYPYNDPGDWDDSFTNYMYINASNPEQVYLSDAEGNPVAWYNTTTDWGYGDQYISTLGSYYLARGSEASAAPYLGYVEDGVIYIAAGSALAADDDGTYQLGAPAADSPWVVLP